MKRILVVDNSPAQLELIGSHLTRHGFAVEQANDGMDALERITREPPDAVLLDLVMPKIDGERVLRYIREHPKFRRLPVVITTGIVEEAPERFEALGADAYVVKGPPETYLPNILKVLNGLLGPAPAPRPPLIGIEKVTARQLVRELLDTKKQLEGILEHMAEGVLKADLNGRVLFANPEAIRIVGHPDSEIFGVSLRDLFPDSPELADALGELVAAAGAAQRLLTLRRDGRSLKMHLSTIPEGRRVSGLLAILEDVTERERLHRALEEKVHEIARAQRQLVRSEKLAATSKLVATLAHEIKNPLNSMNLSLANLDEVLRTAESLPGLQEASQEHMEIVKAGIHRIGEMVDRFMGFARPQEVWLVTKDIHGVLREALRGLAEPARAQGVRITERFADALPPLRMEESELYRAFYNLLLNSLEAMPDGGALEVCTELEERQVVVRIADTGAGIRREDQEKIFDIFFTTKPRGMGLGLSQVFRTVESLGGRILVESEPGRGSTFSLFLPTEHAEAVQ